MLTSFLLAVCAAPNSALDVEDTTTATDETPVPTRSRPPATAWIDYDVDGLPDLFVADPERGDRLLRNRGDGGFEDASRTSGLGSTNGSVIASWTDYDGDGFADVYRVSTRGQGTLWRNLGDGTFVDVTLEAGVVTQLAVLGARWIDYDRDGSPDLEVRTSVGPRLHHNEGGGGFLASDPLAAALPAAPAPGAVGAARVGAGTAPGDESSDGPGAEARSAPTPDGDRAPRRPGAPPSAPTAAAPGAAAGVGTGVLLAPDAICAQGVVDQSSPGECLPASSVPQLGHLYPFGPELNVDATGNVGIGTLSPTSHVHVLDPSTSGSAVLVEITSNSGLAEAVRGETQSTSGTGVVGHARGTVGANTGVIGLTDSNAGTGVYGRSGAAGGATFGVRGDASSSGGTGVLGRATAASGAVKGVHGVSLSTGGHAGYFEGRGYFSDAVGIGTTSPAVPFEVVGEARADTFSIGEDIQLYDSGFDSLYVSAGSDIQLNAGGDILLTGGPVGVNTTNPTALLDVAGTFKTQSLQMSTGAVSGHVLTSDSGGNASWQPAPAGGVGGSGTTGRLPLFTGSMTVGDSALFETAGRIGIGTTSPAPSALLDVEGELQANSLSMAGGDVSLAGTGAFGLDVFADGNIHLNTASEVYITGGQLGVNTTSPTHMVTVQSPNHEDVLRLIGPNSFGHGARLNFGDSDYVYLEEDVDDRFTIQARRTKVLGTGTGEHALHVENAGFGLDGATILAENTSTSLGIGLHARTFGTDGTVVVTQLGSGSLVRGFNAGGLVYEVLNSGRVVTTALQITGGGDLVEGFATAGACEAGTVVVIDPENPGELVCSATAYDTKVAGVVSGAGGVEHGIRMGQDGVLDGETLVAMAGRVYVKGSTENGAIAPGDLLTTASLAGHAMRATDAARSFGSVIGKAMTALDEGEGLVLVLVNLQ